MAAVRTLLKADQIFVYEGLPHPRDEPDLLGSEMKRVKPAEFLTERFYPEPHVAAAADVAFIHGVASRPGWFEAIGVRFCDGREEVGDIKFCLFHADYALEWTHEGKLRRMLLCFGCLEAIYFDQDVEVTSYTAVPLDLRDRLLQYRRHRPDSDAWPPAARTN